MNFSEIERLLARWQERGLLSEEQAGAIRAFEAEEQAAAALEEPAAEASAFDIGALLSYGGALVALGAVIGLYFTLFDDLGHGGRVPLTWGVALAAGALAWVFARARGGSAAADATGFAATVLLAWAVVEVFDAIGWFGDRAFVDEAGYQRDLHEMRATWLTMGLVVGAAGYALARLLPAPMAAGASVVAFTWAVAVVGWWIGNSGSDSPGILGGQMAVISGIVLGGLVLVEAGRERLQLGGRALLWWLVGAFGAANVAAVILSGEEGGAYEALLLVYAIGLAVLAVFARRRVVLVFAALFLYEWVGFVVFRTFEGAVAAIIVTALVGLGTAIGGIAVQRGLAERLMAFRDRASHDATEDATQEPPGSS